MRTRPPHDAWNLAVAFSEIARPEILRCFYEDSCIQSTWITLETFRRYEIEGLPFPTIASVRNGALVRHERAIGRARKDQDEVLAWYREDG